MTHIKLFPNWWKNNLSISLDNGINKFQTLMPITALFRPLKLSSLDKQSIKNYAVKILQTQNF